MNGREVPEHRELALMCFAGAGWEVPRRTELAGEAGELRSQVLSHKEEAKARAIRVAQEEGAETVG